MHSVRNRGRFYRSPLSTSVSAWKGCFCLGVTRLGLLWSRPAGALACLTWEGDNPHPCPCPLPLPHLSSVQTPSLTSSEQMRTCSAPFALKHL